MTETKIAPEQSVREWTYRLWNKLAPEGGIENFWHEARKQRLFERAFPNF